MSANRKNFNKTRRRSMRLITQMRRRMVNAINMVFSRNVKFPSYFQTR